MLPKNDDKKYTLVAVKLTIVIFEYLAYTINNGALI
jgi:hypothetical protein